MHDRELDEFDTYIRYFEGVSILKKVLEKEKHFMSESASAQKPFGLRTYARPQESGDLVLISSGGTGPFKRKDVPAGIDWIDKWKLMTSIRTQEHAGQADKDGMKRILSRTEVLPPRHICTESYIVISVQDSEERIMNVYSYIKTKFARFMMSLVTSSQAINKQSFAYVPILDFNKPWTDKELYDRYNLDKDERNYIESMIKPMGDDALFDADDLIDPEFANFDLAEHGVKVGDKIIYTPTKQELTVAEDNRVEYDGELYTLSQFTAKYMPRNKRSVSGVCQGPKYFSYKGVSLYKMKESFLGGQK